MGDFYFKNYRDYKEAVIEEIEIMGEIPQSGAQGVTEANENKVKYGYRTRIGADILAAELLGITNNNLFRQNSSEKDDLFVQSRKRK